MTIRIAFTAVCVLLIVGCSTQSSERARALSPDGVSLAILDWEGYGGGAGSTIERLYLIEAHGDGNRGKPLLVASKCGDMTMAWKDAHTLQINYSSICHISQFDNKWWSKSALRNLGSAESGVEIILSRNTQ